MADRGVPAAGKDLDRMTRPRLVPVAGVALALAACGASSAAPSTSSSRVRSQSTRAGRCPHPPPSRSSAGAPSEIAPAAPAWTTFCIYGQWGRQRGRVVARASYRGGPLDRALNGSVARLPPRTFCASVASLPSVVVLRYRRTTRFVALDTGGCPDVVMRSGTRRYLSDNGAGTVTDFYVKTVDIARRPGAPEY